MNTKTFRCLWQLFPLSKSKSYFEQKITESYRCILLLNRDAKKSIFIFSAAQLKVSHLGPRDKVIFNLNFSEFQLLTCFWVFPTFSLTWWEEQYFELFHYKIFYDVRREIFIPPFISLKTHNNRTLKTQSTFSFLG